MPPTASPHTRREAIRGFLFATATVVACVALLCAAALAPAPAPVLPFIAMLCVGCPMIATLSLQTAVGALRADARQVAELRRSLERLPETEHPLGF